MKNLIFKAEVLPKDKFYLKYFVEIILILFLVLGLISNSMVPADIVGYVVICFLVLSIMVFFNITFSSKIILNGKGIKINDKTYKKEEINYSFKIGETFRFNSLVLTVEKQDYYIPLITRKSRIKSNLLVRFI